MSIKLIKGFDQSQPMACGTSSTVVKGQLLAFDRSNKIVIPWTAALLVEDIAGVSVNTPAAADTVCNVIPTKGGQEWEVDCTATTATNQLCIRHLMTDGLTVNNTSTDATTASAVFHALEVKGAAAAKKLRGAFTPAFMPKALS